MKKKSAGYSLLLISQLLIVMCIFHPTFAYAVRPISPLTPGLSGYAGVLLIGTQRKSNLDTQQSAKLDKLTQSATAEIEPLLVPSFELRYGLANERTQFYLGSQTERLLDVTFPLELGLRQRMTKSMLLRAAYLPALLSTDQWKDPYLVGQTRSVTEQSSSGFLLGVEHLAFSLNYAQAKIEIDDERSGSALESWAQNALRRGGDYRALRLDVGFPLKKNILLLPALQHVQGDLDGAAMSHTQTTLNMGLMFKLASSRLIVSVGSGQRSYDTQNPVFNVRQNDDLVNASVLYLRGRTGLWGAPSMTALLSYQSSDANIDFYDESSLTALLSLNWPF